jgi:heme transport system permease protein
LVHASKSALGEAEAFHLGIEVEKAKRLIVLATAACVGAAVAVSGIIGFVGLVVPHIVRAAGIRRHRALLVGSALAGATLVVCADLLGRVLRPPAELPLGAVTALIGVPFFLAKLRRLT